MGVGVDAGSSGGAICRSLHEDTGETARVTKNHLLATIRQSRRQSGPGGIAIETGLRCFVDRPRVRGGIAPTASYLGVRSPMDYLVFRVYKTAKHIISSADRRIAVAIVCDYERSLVLVARGAQAERRVAVAGCGRRDLPLEGLPTLADNQAARHSAVVSRARFLSSQISRLAPLPGHDHARCWTRSRLVRLRIS